MTHSISSIRNLILALFCLITGETIAQTFRFNTYGIEDGIRSQFIYNIIQDQKGFLWIGTGAGLCRFDGFQFNFDIPSDTLIESIVQTSFKDSKGDLWFGHRDGTIGVYNGKNLKVFNTAEYTVSPINDIIEDDKGNLFFATQNDGILKLQPAISDTLMQFEMPDLLIYSLGFIEDNKFLAGTQESLYMITLPEDPQSRSIFKQITNLPSTKIKCITKNKDNDLFWIGTEDNGLFQLTPATNSKESFLVENLGEQNSFADINIQAIFEDIDGNLWLSTFRDGVIKVKIDAETNKLESYFTYSIVNGLRSNNINYVYKDIEGNIWICTFDKGLANLLSDAFTFYSFDEGEPVESISSLLSDNEYIWLGGERGVLKIDKYSGKEILFISDEKGLSGKVTALFKDTSGDIWIGTETRGIYRMSGSSGRITLFFRSSNYPENSVKFITGKNETLWVATGNGIFNFNIKTGESRHITTRDGLPHNKINHLFIDSENKIWISTISNVLYIITPDGRLESGREIKYFSTQNEFISVVEDKNGEFWAATSRNGVYRFTSDTVYNYSIEHGLKSSYCYSILADDQNNIWVGHRLGFSKIILAEGNIITYGSNIGITGDCNKNAIIKERDGEILFGMSSGIIRYNRKMDRGSLLPPLMNIVSMKFSDQEVDLDKMISLPYDKYRLRIDFIGLSYRNPEMVTYQYKLENYDDEWSERSVQRYASYGRIEDGEYIFLLRSFNSDGFSSEQPLTIPILIKKPFWKTWWFYTSLVVFLVASVITIIKVRERNHRKLQAFLQTSLDNRTREVVMQRDEIEFKNREITDSIHYAQRIQASILPPIRKLKDTFPEFFILYRPRDIVSGDFYWFDKINDDKFIIVCADSTGHGVPGAFMSMIGSTLINDIVNRFEIFTPSRILTTLDQEVTEALNQDIEAERSNDGMDIVVCEINTKTRLIKFASAMRPVIFYHKGEQYYIRGNRSSVGGEIIEEKIFDDQEYYLDKGDVIYMFSDGYPDQFGGPMGKKFKMARVKDLLDDVQGKSMQEQYEYIKNNFDLWRKDYEQVDDILFMGIRI
jgi:ligand-binding sensor domain-containing protein/serine phosphatase RsbU (regulator of sigma subunit)